MGIKLVDVGIRLRKGYNITSEIRWMRTVYEVDTLEHGGWMYVGDWINLSFQDNVKAPCPVIVCSIGPVYSLFFLDKDGNFELVMHITEDKGWADTMLPAILSFYAERGDEKTAQVEISGKALQDARWLMGFLEGDKSNIENAVAYALKFTKESWTKRVEPKNTLQSTNTNP